MRRTGKPSQTRPTPGTRSGEKKKVRWAKVPNVLDCHCYEEKTDVEYPSQRGKNRRSVYSTLLKTLRKEARKELRGRRASERPPRGDEETVEKTHREMSIENLSKPRRRGAHWETPSGKGGIGKGRGGGPCSPKKEGGKTTSKRKKKAGSLNYSTLNGGRGNKKRGCRKIFVWEACGRDSTQTKGLWRTIKTQGTEGVVRDIVGEYATTKKNQGKKGE